MSLLLFFSWTTAVENKLQTENVIDNLPKYGLGRRVECLRGGATGSLSKVWPQFIMLMIT